MFSIFSSKTPLNQPEQGETEREQQLGSYRLTEAAATALLLLTLCFSLFWLVERGLGGRHVDH